MVGTTSFIVGLRQLIFKQTTLPQSLVSTKKGVGEQIRIVVSSCKALIKDYFSSNYYERISSRCIQLFRQRLSKIKKKSVKGYSSLLSVSLTIKLCYGELENGELLSFRIVGLKQNNKKTHHTFFWFFLMHSKRLELTAFTTVVAQIYQKFLK